MALTHHWQHGPFKQLTLPMIHDEATRQALLAMAKTREEWERIELARKAIRDRRARTIAYGKRFESLRRTR